MEAAVRPDQRHALELADGPDGVEVSEQQDLRRPAAEFREQVIAPVHARKAGNAAADRLEARRERAPAPIDGGLVGGRRFETHERLDRLEQPRLFVAAEIAQAYNRG